MPRSLLSAPALVVALDVPNAEQAMQLATAIQPVTPWMKVGLELFTVSGPDIIRRLKDTGCSVFLDLKFHDIPNTVAGAVSSAIAAGADICDIHMSGGSAMAKAAAQAITDNKSDCLLLGVTVLTSSSPDELGLSSPEALKKLVLERSLQAQACGLDGVVCSGWEAASVKQVCGQNFICLCPGIRPAGGSIDDQHRVLTPKEAIGQGANFLVVGRPITRALNPVLAARQILESMQG